MSPISKTRGVAPPKLAAPGAPSLEQVGALAATAGSAAKSVKELKTQLKAADTAFKANPKNAVLGAKVKQLLEQTKSAIGAQEKAEAALGTALGKLVKGSAREQAAALTALLPKLEVLLKAANKANSAATAQFVKDTDAAVAKPTDANVAKANASQARAQKAADTLKQLTAAGPAIEAAIGAKENTALEQARANGVPGAKDVADVGDLASKSRDEQVRLVGAPVVGISPEAAVALDVMRIHRSMLKSPENAARMLKMQLEGSTWPQQQALIKAAAPMIKQMVDAAQGQPAVAGVLLDTLKVTDPIVRRELAAQISSGPATVSSPLMVQLQARIARGEGLVEGIALSKAFEKSGRPALAKAIEGPLTEKVKALTADFAAKGEKVARLNTDLARLVVGFGPMLPADKRQAAIESFKARHQAEYAAWEASGAKLGPATQFALERGDAKLAALLPDFLATRAGEDAMMQALALQAENKPSLLDSVPQLLRDTNEGAKLAGHVSTTLVKGVAFKAMELTKTGKLVEAQALLQSLERNATLFGVGAESMEKLTAKMSDVLKGGGKESINALTQEFKDLEAGTPGFVDRRAQALKGLGLALSAFALVDKAKEFDALSIKDQIGTVAEGLGVGVDGGLLAMEVIGRGAASKLLMLGKSVSAATGAVAAVMDGISAVQAFREGKHAEGVASSASAVGGAILATAAFSAAAGAQVVPVAGQVVGAVLVIGGTIAKWTIEERRASKAERSIENDAKAFLEAAGVEGPAANELSDLLRKDGRNVGPFIQQTAKMLGIGPEVLFQRLQRLTPENLDKFVDMSKDWPVDTQGQFKRTGPESLEVAKIWMAEDGVWPEQKAKNKK